MLLIYLFVVCCCVVNSADAAPQRASAPLRRTQKRRKRASCPPAYLSCESVPPMWGKRNGLSSTSSVLGPQSYKFCRTNVKRAWQKMPRNLNLTLSPQIYTTAMGRHRSAGVPAVFQGGRREKPGSSRARPGCTTDTGTTGTKQAGTRHACRPGPVAAQRRPPGAFQLAPRSAADFYL